MKIDLSIFISVFAFILSALAFWKTHLSPFKLLTTFGLLVLRIYPIKSGEHRWFLLSANLPLTFLNTGAKPGIIKDLRIVLTEKIGENSGKKFILPAEWEIETKLFEHDPKDRFSWLDSVVKSYWYPTAILPSVLVSKNILFENRWEQRELGHFNTSLEVLVGDSEKWRKLGEWDMVLDKARWDDFEKGKSLSLPDLSFSQRRRDVIEQMLQSFRLRGPDTSPEPSYLDYINE